jgi:hypothetical protein
MNPIIPEDIFEWNPNHTFSFENGVVICDNWYRYPERIEELFSNFPAPRGKYSKTSKNWVDYYDCRPMIPCHFPSKSLEPLEVIAEILRECFVDSLYDLTTEIYEFNAYKNIRRGVSNNLQHHPHIDDDVFNCIVYLDRVESGGTAIYDMERIPLNEEHDILYDVSEIPKRVIPAKFNRMVMFDGNIMHGGYIENHDAYIDNWRINHAMCMKPLVLQS